VSGPAPGTGCLVCEHQDSALINQALGSGLLSNRKVALKFGVPKDSVNRHVYKRHPGAPQAGGARGALPDEGSSQLDRLKLIRQQLEEDMAERPRAETSRELRQVNQRIGEIEGTDRPRSVTVADVEGLSEQVAAWFRALEPFPEARDAMMAATDPRLLASAGVEG
jgi:hypothetical protein